MCCGRQVPLLVAPTSAVSEADLREWVRAMLAGDPGLAGHVRAHRVLPLEGVPSRQAAVQLGDGLAWLAAHSPTQPRLQVRCLAHCSQDLQGAYAQVRQAVHHLHTALCLLSTSAFALSWRTSIRVALEGA